MASEINEILKVMHEVVNGDWDDTAGDFAHVNVSTYADDLDEGRRVYVEWLQGDWDDDPCVKVDFYTDPVLDPEFPDSPGYRTFNWSYRG